ncbi:MAG: BtaA family protein [Pyrinomonadaceae bacterium]|nr:BtaA family protein [Pyrinomonadaceae bacterium]
MSSNEATLQSAVQHKATVSKQGILQKMFAVWFDAFVYNQIWEDPRVDLQALKLDENSRVITISSGGCNALNYLVEKPEKVTAVDLNRHHIFLLRLKLAALEFLPTHGDFFAFFGHGKGEQNTKNYQRFIAPNLDEETRNFWDKKIGIFNKDGLYEHSRNGYFLRFFHRFANLIGCQPHKVLEAKNKAEQLELYEKYVNPFFDSFFIKTVGKLPITMFGLGIPPQQYEELKKDLAEGGSIIDIYRERTKRLAVDYPISENYFAWQAFARKYDTEKFQAVPEYLKAENFAGLKENVSRVSAKIGSVTDEIKSQPVGTFNRFVFLDAQDWMNPPILTDLWSTIAERGEKGSRIIFRTAGANSPLENALPTELLAKFKYEKDWSEELFKQDRASIYGGFHLYILQ